MAPFVRVSRWCHVYTWHGTSVMHPLFLIYWAGNRNQPFTCTGDVVPGRIRQQGSGPSLPRSLPRTLLGDVTEPGAYVCPDGGELIRVVETGASSEEAELIEKHGAEPIYVMRISKDPFIPVSEARIAAANLDIEVKF